MSRLLVKLLSAATVGGLLSSSPLTAQILPPEKKAERVKIMYGPVLEIAYGDLAIVRWITNNPGGSDDHYAIADFGTDPKDLSQRAKSRLRLNRGHRETIFRVRITGLKPTTTYYYTVTSEESNGTSDGVKSAVNKFTMPGSGERIVHAVNPDGTLRRGGT
jgi:hypothetical protein